MTTTPAPDFDNLTTDAEPALDDAMRQAKAQAIWEGRKVTVRYWDGVADPYDPGWMLRTYGPAGDYTEEIL